MLALMVVVVAFLLLIGGSILNDPYRDDENNAEIEEWNETKKHADASSWRYDER